MMLQDTIAIGLLQNTAILLSLSMLYEFLWLRYEDHLSAVRKVAAGLIIGSITILVMSTPWTYVPGIVFDMRSVGLSVSGLFFGPFPTLIAIGMAAIMRFIAGGGGMWMGITVIISSGLIGILWGHFRPQWSKRNQIIELLSLGLVVHLVMLASTLLLPSDSMPEMAQFLSLPLFLIYTPATILLGLVLRQQKINHFNRKAAQKLILLSKAIDQIPVSVVITNKEGVIQYINPAFTKITGYSEEKVMGKTPAFLHSDNQDKNFYKALWDNILQGNDWKGNIQNRKSDGTLFWEYQYISPIFNKKGQITHFVAVKEDITEKKKLLDDLFIAKEKAEESDRLKTAFLMNISHEIRTPLNGINGFASLMADSPPGPEKTAEYSKIILQSGNLLLNLINDLIEISKIESGSEEINVSEFQIETFLVALMNHFKIQANSKNISLEYRLDELKNHKTITTDPQRLLQILSNLMQNALKFSEKGTIEAGCFDNEDTVTFYVKDEGIGIEPALQEKVFQSFFQAETTHLQSNPGIGLGLTICKSLVTLLRGSLHLESESGKGSTFFVSIPAH